MIVGSIARSERRPRIASTWRSICSRAMAGSTADATGVGAGVGRGVGVGVGAGGAKASQPATARTSRTAARERRARIMPSVWQRLRSWPPERRSRSQHPIAANVRFLIVCPVVALRRVSSLQGRTQRTFEGFLSSLPRPEAPIGQAPPVLRGGGRAVALRVVACVRLAYATRRTPRRGGYDLGRERPRRAKRAGTRTMRAMQRSGPRGRHGASGSAQNVPNRPRHRQFIAADASEIAFADRTTRLVISEARSRCMVCWTRPSSPLRLRLVRLGATRRHHLGASAGQRRVGSRLPPHRLDGAPGNRR